MKAKTISQAIKNKDKVTHLDLSEQKLTELPKEILDLPKLSILNIQYNQLTELPNWLSETNISELLVYGNQISVIGTLPNSIVRLHLAKNQLTILPAYLKDCGKLKQIYLYDNPLKKESLNVLASIPYLEDCNLNDIHLTEFPIELQEAPHLKSLALYRNGITAVPKLTGFYKLESLYLVDNQLTSIDESLTQLPRLTYLDVSRNQLNHIPDFFELEFLSISNNKFEKLPSSFSTIPQEYSNLKSFHFGDNPLEEKPIDIFLNLKAFPRISADGIFEGDLLWGREEFVKACHKKGYDITTQKVFCNILLQPKEQLNDISLGYFFKALQVNYTNLQSKVLDHILSDWEEKLKTSSLQKGSSVTILGKVNIAKTEAKQRLKKVGVNYSPKITNKTTHVVVQKGGTKYENVDAENLIFIPEKALQAYLDEVDKLYLHDENTPQEAHDNLHDLLFSVDSDMVNMGLEMLKSLGVPKNIITELFLITKNTRLANKVRNKAKKYLLLNCSEQLKKNLEQHGAYYKVVTKEPYFDDLGVMRLIQDTEIEKDKLAHYVVLHTQTHHQHVADFYTDSEKNIKHLEQFLIEHSTIPLDPMANRWWSLHTKHFLNPQDIFKVTPHLITSLSISTMEDYNLIKDNLYQLKALKILFVDNLEIKELPPKFEQLTNLEKLSLSYNEFEEFPTQLEEMENLKRISIYGNPFCEDNKYNPNKKKFKLKGGGFYRK